MRADPKGSVCLVRSGGGSPAGGGEEEGAVFVVLFVVVVALVSAVYCFHRLCLDSATICASCCTSSLVMACVM